MTNGQQPPGAIGIDTMSVVDGDARLQTYSGRWFSLDAPRSGDVELIDIAHALSNLCRFAGHTRDFYSVAEHSVLVCDLLDLAAFDDWQVRAWARFVALFHDAAEAYTGDLIRDLKVRLRGSAGDAEDGFDAIEDRVQAAIWQRFRCPILEALDPDCAEEDRDPWTTLLVEVKHADLRALATEKRDLMGYGPGNWRTVANFSPAAGRIEPLDPEEAFALFLRRYAEVRP